MVLFQEMQNHLLRFIYFLIPNLRSFICLRLFKDKLTQSYSDLLLLELRENSLCYLQWICG